jgi:hypothetical protein
MNNTTEKITLKPKPRKKAVGLSLDKDIVRRMREFCADNDIQISHTTEQLVVDFLQKKGVL